MKNFFKTKPNYLLNNFKLMIIYVYGQYVLFLSYKTGLFFKILKLNPYQFLMRMIFKKRFKHINNAKIFLTLFLFILWVLQNFRSIY
jgi:hypothetical protein